MTWRRAAEVLEIADQVRLHACRGDDDPIDAVGERGRLLVALPADAEVTDVANRGQLEMHLLEELELALQRGHRRAVSDQSDELRWCALPPQPAGQ